MKVALLLARKDLRALARSRTLVVLLVAYPLLLALLVGGVLLRQGPPRIAYVNEDGGASGVRIGEETFSLDSYVQRAERGGVDVVRLDRDEALRSLDEGQVAGVLIVPRGTTAKLKTQLSGTEVTFVTGDDPFGDVVAQRVQGVVYGINLRISAALIETNRDYLDTLVTGGEVNVNGDRYDLYGLAPIEDDLRDVQDELEDQNVPEELLDRISRAIEFADDAGAAIGLADNALEATAAPIRLEREREAGKSPLLTAQALGFALATSIAFVCTVLVAASLAAERDEGVLGRVLAGMARGWQVLVGKLVLGGVLAVGFSVGIFAVVTLLAPQAWARLPLLLACVVVASLAASAIGALLAVLTRDAGTATLAGILLVLPLLPLSLVGGDTPLSWISELFPVAPSRALFNAALFDAHPWDSVLRDGSQLLLIAAVAGAGALRGLRRLA